MYSKLRMRFAISRHLRKDEAIHSEYSTKSVEYFVRGRSGTNEATFLVIHIICIRTDVVRITSTLL